MQKIINAMAIFSFGVTSVAVAGGIYAYTSRGAIIEGVKSKVLEQVSLQEVEGLESKTENLCLSGGSFLNCNANSKIVKESKFKKNFDEFKF